MRNLMIDYQGDFGRFTASEFRDKEMDGLEFIHTILDVIDLA